MRGKIPILFAGLMAFIAMQGCSENGKPQEVNNSADYHKQGDKIAQLTFDTLRKELAHAVESKGVMEAIDYCQLNALNVTSIYKEGETTSISRAALKARNPVNLADSLETVVLNGYIEAKSKVRPLTSQIVSQGSSTHYFKPILLQSACLSCHGNPYSEIKPEVLSQIQKKYPNDKATGFKVGDVRGIWHIIFKSQK